MRLKIVEWQVNMSPGLEGSDMFYKQVIVDCIGMVEINGFSEIQWKLVQIAVIRILLQKDDITRANRLENFVCDSCLTSMIINQASILGITLSNNSLNVSYTF